MSADWTPPAAAVEAAARAIRDEEILLRGAYVSWDALDERSRDTYRMDARAAVAAAYPAILAEKEAEIERLNRKVERMRQFQVAVGMGHDEDLELLAALAALVDEWERYEREGNGWVMSSVDLRAVLADHADTLANVKADAWDEGAAAGGQYGHEDDWTSELNPLRDNPYRTTEGTDQ